MRKNGGAVVVDSLSNRMESSARTITNARRSVASDSDEKEAEEAAEGAVMVVEMVDREEVEDRQTIDFFDACFKARHSISRQQ